MLRLARFVQWLLACWYYSWFLLPTDFERFSAAVWLTYKTFGACYCKCFAFWFKCFYDPHVISCFCYCHDRAYKWVCRVLYMYCESTIITVSYEITVPDFIIYQLYIACSLQFWEGNTAYFLISTQQWHILLVWPVTCTLVAWKVCKAQYPKYPKYSNTWYIERYAPSIYQGKITLEHPSTTHYKPVFSQAKRFSTCIWMFS